MSHNFVTSSADWDQLDAELPRYKRYEPSRAKESDTAVRVILRESSGQEVYRTSFKPDSPNRSRFSVVSSAW